MVVCQTYNIKTHIIDEAIIDSVVVFSVNLRILQIWSFYFGNNCLVNLFKVVFNATNVVLHSITSFFGWIDLHADYKNFFFDWDTTPMSILGLNIPVMH